MKKSFLLLIIFLSVFTVSYAQVKTEKVDVVWGEKQKTSKKSTLSDIIGYDDTGIYAIKSRIKGIAKIEMSIEHYDNNMNLTRSNIIDFKSNKGIRKTNAVKQFGNEIFFFYSVVDRKNKKNEFFVDKFDKKLLTVKGEPKKIGEMDLSNTRFLQYGSFNVRTSQDTSKILVYYNFPNKIKDNEQYGMIVYNRNFEKLWERETILPYKDYLFRVKDAKVSNAGKVYISGKLFKDKLKAELKGKSNYNFHILRYSEDEEANEFPISMEGTFFTDLQFTINKKEDIICGGFYSESGASRNLKGSFYLKIDGKTKELTSKSLQEFDLEFITQNYTERQKKHAKKRDAKGDDVELSKFWLDDIILRTDGGLCLVGEQYYTRTETNTMTDANGHTTTSTTIYYYYNDIIVVSISPEGKIDWTEKIAKRQTSVNDKGFYSSYKLSVINNKLYFFYNDNPKNHYKNESGNIAPFKHKEGIVTMVELDVDGRMTKEALFTTNDTDVITRPKVCEQISDDVVIIFGQRKKYQQFAKIKFK